jgi:hypothetical protein
MELVKLINLCKETNAQIPSTFEEFGQVFLDDKGNFTEEGVELYLDMITGVVSYLNREGDVREFAQPKIEQVNVKMSERPVGDIKSLKEEHDKNVRSIKDILRQLDGSFDIFSKTKRQQIKNEIKDQCGHLKGEEYIQCKNNPSAFIKVLEKSIVDMGSKINDIKSEHSEELKKLDDEFNKVKLIYENNISQQHVIEKTCKKDNKKK